MISAGTICKFGWTNTWDLGWDFGCYLLPDDSVLAFNFVLFLTFIKMMLKMQDAGTIWNTSKKQGHFYLAPLTVFVDILSRSVSLSPFDVRKYL